MPRSACIGAGRGSDIPRASQTVVTDEIHAPPPKPFEALDDELSQMATQAYVLVLHTLP